MKKLKNIASKGSSVFLGFFLLLLWEGLVWLEWLPAFIIPPPSAIFLALVKEWRLLLFHSSVTFLQAMIGLVIGVGLAFIFAVLMDRFSTLKKAIYPYLIISQTIPTVAIAPILVLWLGYDMLPKIVLVVLTTLFPILISILEGFAAVDTDAVQLLELMGARPIQVLTHVKLPSSLAYFFSGLKISVSYAFVASVIAEWLGGFEGLGVYMIRSKNAFAYANMFAAIVIISVVSLLMLGSVHLLERFLTPWNWQDKKERRFHK